MATQPRKPSRKPAEPTSAGALDIAMDAASKGGAADSPAQRLLIDQRRLVRWQVANERMRFVLGALVGLAGVIVAGLIGLAVWQASQAEGLIVEEFSVPPELAQRGLTGAAVADEVLDQLSRLNRQGNSIDSVRLSDTWTSNSRVEIPQTGVSIDELNRFLRRWLGNQTLVTGTVVRTDKGVSLTARTEGGFLVRAEGPVSDLPVLAGSVAEQLLSQTKPVTYARFLMARGDFAGAEPILKTVIASSNAKDELGAAHLALSNLYQFQGRVQDSRRHAQASLDHGREFAVMTLALMERALGHAGPAAASCDRAERIEIWRQGVVPAQMRLQTVGSCRLMTGDYRTAATMFEALIGQRGQQYENYLWSLIGSHETSAARRHIPLMMAVPAQTSRHASFIATMTAKLLAEEEDWPALLAALEQPAAPLVPGQLETPTPDAWRALALARMGRLAEAKALAATLPGDCYRCLRFRAEVAEAGGDRASADRYFAEALRQAPELAFAETEWARVLLARGDAKGAVSKARAASAKNPRFADAQVAWGEALLAAGDAKGAIGKLEAAAELTPLWGRLHLVWGEALAKQGKAKAANEQWQIAKGLDLTAAEQARLERNLAGGKV